MPDPDDVPELPPEELLAAEEELLGKPKPMRAEEALEAMQKRIAYLEQMLADSIGHLDDGREPSAEVEQMMTNTRRELAEARARLREYQLQRDGLN